LQSEQLCQLRSQCNELTTKLSAVTQGLQQLQEEKTRVDKTNEILLESVRVAQTQKDIYCEEQEKIQNLQQIEIDKLKNLLSFREQESVDRMGHMRQQSSLSTNLIGPFQASSGHEVALQLRPSRYLLVSSDLD